MEESQAGDRVKKLRPQLVEIWPQTQTQTIMLDWLDTVSAELIRSS